MSPAQNILAVMIPYVEWHNAWSIISTSAFWRTAEPSSSGKQIENKDDSVEHSNLLIYWNTTQNAFRKYLQTLLNLQVIPDSK